MKVTAKQGGISTETGSRRINGLPVWVRTHPSVAVAMVLLLIVTGFLGGYWFRAANPETAAAVSDMQFVLQQQQAELGALRRAHQNQVDALAMRLAELHAGSTRVNALAQRLVEMGQMDPEEFDFSEQSAQGGPERNVLSVANKLPDVSSELSGLEKRLQQQRVQLQALEFLLLNRELDQALKPAGWPIDGGWISSGYGQRTDPFSGKPALHQGIDFAGARGTPVQSVAGGVVIWAGPRDAYGNTVDIDHGNGYVTRYAHNQAVTVKLGQQVDAGEVIAEMGSSGRASAPHVHFEVLKNGHRMNPWQFIKALRKPLAAADHT